MTSIIRKHLRKESNNQMRKEELFKQYAGKYRLIKVVIGGSDASDKYINGWKDKSFYMFFEIAEDGQCTLKTPDELLSEC